jgi:hypothetical protein
MAEIPPVRREDLRLRNSILERIDKSPLSEVLPSVLRLAKARRHDDLARWVRLELDGYFDSNPAMTSDVVVPDYRVVPGQYYDDYGRRLANNDPKLNFIFEDRLRFGVRELERLVESHDHIRVQRTSNIALVREYLKVDVTTFAFPASAVSGVLASIRSELIERFSGLDEEVSSAGLTLEDREPAARRSWLRDHLWPVAVTVGTGLLVAYLSYRFGWL